MKIVHIITRLILGGAQENTLISCRLLAERGHNVTLITGPALGPEGDLYKQTKNQKYKTIIIDKLRRPICPIYDSISYHQIKKLLNKIKPGIVHTHSAKAGILGRLAAYNLRCHCESRCRLSGRGNLKPKIIHTIHGLAFHPYQNNLLNKFYIACEKFAAKKTDAFLTVADAMTAQALAARIGKPDMFTTAYSAIDEDAFLNPIVDEQKASFRQKYNIPNDAVVLVTVARLFMLKGHDYIIESAKTLSQKFPNTYWLFVGDGNLTDLYKQQVTQLGLAEKFIFTGLLPPQNIPLALQSSDILVHCSLREGLARAIPQAMLCAKAAIAFDLDGSKEVVNQHTGRLIEPQNIQQLITACSELIENKNLRTQLGQNAREYVKEKFAPDTMVNTIEQAYKKLLEI